MLKYIRWNAPSDLSKLFSDNTSLNILDQRAFNIAIEKNYTAITRLLLDYFNNVQLDHSSSDTEKQLLQYQLRSVLEIAIEEVSLSQEMSEVLLPYLISQENENDQIEDFSNSELEYHSGSDECLQTEDSEKQHNNDIKFEQELYTYLDRDALSLHDELIGE